MSQLPVVWQALLQFFLAKRFVRETGDDSVASFMTELLQTLGEDESSPNRDFHKIIHELNKPLGLHGMRITKLNADDNEARVYYCLVNTLADDISKIATTYSEKELRFFKELIAEMVKKTEVGSVDAINLAKAVPSFRQSDAEVLLQRLVNEKWVYKSLDNRYSLGLRSVSELAPYIEAEFGEHAVPECVCCSHFVVRGPRCPTAQCTAILHRRCAVDWFSQAQTVKCPCCQNPWELSDADKRAVERMKRSQNDRNPNAIELD